MDDLRVPPGPGAPGGLIVPAAELIEQFSHAGGPGGQGVNTADSRVQLSFDIGATTALSAEQRARVLQALAARLFGTVLMVTAAEERSQRRNRLLARDRLSDLLRTAVAPPVPRRATRPTAGSKRRRLEAKKRTSAVKAARRRPNTD